MTPPVSLAQDVMSAAQPSPVRVSLRPDQIDILRKALAQAETQGFEHEAFTPANLDGLLASDNAAAQRQGQGELVAAVLRYARAVHSGRLSTGDFEDEWGLHPTPFDPAPGFAAAVAGDRLQAWLDSLPPPYAGYQSLRDALSAYRGLAAAGGWDIVPAGPDLKLGMVDPRVAALRRRLAVEDPNFDDAAKQPRLFDDALYQAVVRAQKRYGLDPTGAVGAQTLAALNVPVVTRILEIQANMERWRWLPATLPADRIQVNIAAAILTVFHGDSPVLSMRAATGRPDDHTPMLSSQVQSIVFNPPWNVPSSIATKELWPKEKAHPGYLKHNDFITIKTPDGGVRLQQKAGDKSALGRVKFDFPNRYGVYLHDTPAHSAFSRFSRQVSHGCVRLEKPLVLANALLEGDEKWTPDAVQAALDKGDTVRAPLQAPISVYLFYWTVFVGPDGGVNFRADPYDWDADLMQRIAASTRSAA